jgi:hypothetical protein
MVDLPFEVADFRGTYPGLVYGEPYRPEHQAVNLPDALNKTKAR